MSTQGIPVSHFAALIDEWGGRAALAGKSTADVCFGLVRPMTERTKLSLCDQYKLDPARAPLIKDAQWFVSHAWMNPFLNVVDALVTFYTDAGMDLDTTHVWFDIFSNSQHDTNLKPFEWWQTTFMDAIEKIGNVVMILEPFQNPVCLTRVWCIFEVYSCKKTNSNFHVAMTPTQRQEFMVSLKDPSQFYNVVSNIRCANAQATNPPDRERIFEVIRKQMTDFSSMDRLVFGVFNEWVVKQLEGTVAAGVDVEEWKFVLAQLHNLLGDSATCLQLCKEILDASPEYGAGQESGLQVKVSNLMAGSLLYQGKVDDAIKLYEKALSISDDGGVSAAELASTKSNLALAYMKQGRYKESEFLSLQAIPELTQIYGPYHINVLDICNNLAVCYTSTAEYKKSRDLSLSIVDTARETLGKDHPNLWLYLENLGRAHRELGEFKEAEEVYIECLDGQRRVFGLDHVDTLVTMNQLAEVYLGLGKLEDSFSLFRTCWMDRSRILGETHVDTILSLYGVGRVQRAQGKLDIAESTIQYCWELFQEVLGREHPNSLVVMSTLAQIYEKLGKFDKCEELLKQSASMAEKVWGMDSPNGLNSASALGLFYFNRHRLEEAKNIFSSILSDVQRVFGESHGNSIVVLSRLALIHRTLNELEEAERLYLVLVDVETPPASSTLYALGDVYWKLGVDSKAESVLLDLSNREGDEYALNAISFLGKIYLSEGREADAEALYNRYVEICQSQKGVNSIYTLQVMARRADCFERNGKGRECVEQRLEILELCESVVEGDTSIFTLEAGVSLGKNGKAEEGIKLIQNLLETWPEGGKKDDGMKEMANQVLADLLSQREE
ncbi:hypothetical protein BDR26DRAFT_710084 [Obelidium mucronatum]|nr:hypothetical protein BDR26DRAFT_710084 [Obelidium mucronatum]